MVIDQLQSTILALDQRGTAFHPITAVVVGDIAKLPNSRVMNMTTEHSIDRKFLRVTNNLFLEAANEADRVLDSFLSVGAERPVTEAESAAH